MFSSEQGLKYFTHAIYYKGNREKKTKKKKKKSAEKRARRRRTWNSGEKEKFGIGATERESLGGGTGKIERGLPRYSNRLGGANVREREIWLSMMLNVT